MRAQFRSSGGREVEESIRSRSKLLTSAICRGLHWSTMQCIHASFRQMTDNIFEIESTALAHVACAPQESGVLLTDFAAALSQCQSLLDLLCYREDWVARFSLPLPTKYVQGQHHTRGICGSRTRTIPYGQRSTTRLSCG